LVVSRRPPQASEGAADGLALDLAHASLTLARRFWAGATMWCVAPDGPAHARHIAVEFVHPVIVGKRALDAVAVDDPDPTAALRLLARSGDVAVVVSRADDARALDLLRRAPAWGVTTLWLVLGDGAAPGTADHPLRVDEDDLILAYHVLWELTHVCFEHPGLLVEAPACDPGDPHCITCSDEGRVAEVVDTAGAPDIEVRTPEGLETVDATLAADARPGDLVLVHAGTVLTVIE
jgi:hypothetical protein